MGLLDRFRQRREERQFTTPPPASPPPKVATPPIEVGRTAPPDFAYVEPRFAVVDVETTGLSASSHRILEIAVVTTDPIGRVLDTWATRLNPEGPVGATHIHGITARDVANAPRFCDVVDELNARLRGAAVAAHNARFDLAFLRAEYARAGWRMPFLPSLCTLEASSHHLPHLPRRRLPDVCQAIGLPPHRAHSALHDATATAALLAWFLDPTRPPYPDHLELPKQGHAIPWPATGEGAALPIPTGGTGRQLSAQARRNITASAAAPAAQPLVQLISRFSLLDAIGEGAPEGAVAYLEKLAQALEDGVLSPEEVSALTDLAAAYDLDDAAVQSAHHAFVAALAREAVADGKVTRAERTELQTVADALKVPTSSINSILKHAAARHRDDKGAELPPLPHGWEHGEPLRVGDRVVFTGCEDHQRPQLEKDAVAAGVLVMNGVTRATAMLITDGTKARKANELGTRVVHPSTFRLLLTSNPQPPSPPSLRPPQPRDARPPQ